MNVVKMAARFRKLYSGVVCDAMDYDLGVDVRSKCIMSQSIGRLTSGGQTIAGPALTCNFVSDIAAHWVDDTIRIEMLDAMTPGCVQFMGTWDSWIAGPHACYGDVSACLARSKGCVGLVTSGSIRDVDRINAMHFPVFGAGTMAQDALGRCHIAEYGTPALAPTANGYGTKVVSGQWIFADGDGVLMIPLGREEEVLIAAEKRAETEDNIRQAVRNGEHPKAIYERLGSW